MVFCFYLVEPGLVVGVALREPLSVRVAAKVADVGVGHGLFRVDAETDSVLPAQAQLALDHQAVLFGQTAEAVHQLLLTRYVVQHHRRHRRPLPMSTRTRSSSVKLVETL